MKIAGHSTKQSVEILVFGFYIRYHNIAINKKWQEITIH